jgi:hypothetical protein
MNVHICGTVSQTPKWSAHMHVPGGFWHHSPLLQGMPMNPPQISPFPAAEAPVDPNTKPKTTTSAAMAR